MAGALCEYIWHMIVQNVGRVQPPRWRMSGNRHRFVPDTRFCTDVGSAVRPRHAGDSWFDKARSALSNQLSATSWLPHHEPGNTRRVTRGEEGGVDEDESHETWQSATATPQREKGEEHGSAATPQPPTGAADSVTETQQGVTVNRPKRRQATEDSRYTTRRNAGKRRTRQGRNRAQRRRDKWTTAAGRAREWR